MSVPDTAGPSRARGHLFRQWFPNLVDPVPGRQPWADLKGALAGALASIPLTIAYGLIIGSALGGQATGVGVLVALYGSVVVGLAAVLLGGCPLIVAGPRAATLLVFAALIAQLAHSEALAQVPDPKAAALALACATVLGSGIIQLAFGALRLGRFAEYVPLPVVAGFVNASALLIILSQVWSATGMAPQKSVLAFVDHLPDIKPLALLLSLGTAALVLLLPRVTTKVPAALFGFVAGTAAYHVLAFLGYGLAAGGTLPPPPADFAPGLVDGSLLDLLGGPESDELIRPMLAAAATMALLSTLDTLLTTAATDAATLRRSNGGRQLMAEGLGNALAGMFGLAPGSASLVRTQAALRGGMVSALGPLLVALFTLAVAVALGPLIGVLSQAVMAGLLIALAINLFDKWTLARIRHLLERRKDAVATTHELLVVAVVVATALLANLATAVGIGIVLTLLSFVSHMARSPVRRSYRATDLLPRIHGDHKRRRFITRHGHRIALLELEGPLFFGTAADLEAAVRKLMDKGIVHVVLDLRRMNHIDATGARALENINHRLSAKGGLLVFSHVYRERRGQRGAAGGSDDRRRHQAAPRMNWIRLADLGTIGSIGESRFFDDTDSAVEACESHCESMLEPERTDAGAGQESSMPHSLRGALRRQLRRYCRRMTYQAGDQVFHQGAQPDGAYFLARGRVDVLIDLHGTERKLRIQSLTSGAIFGELGLIDARPRSASIVATEPTTCYWMDATGFERLRQEQPAATVSLISDIALIFAERLRANAAMLAEMEK